MDKTKIAVVLTCHNRKEKTVRCLSGLKYNSEHEYHFVVVDDGSTDNTVEAIGLIGLKNLHIVQGDGNLFWNRGMHAGINYVHDNLSDCDYVLLVNDDVDFFVGIIDKMVNALSHNTTRADVLVGATQSDEKKLSYGGILYTKGINYRMISPEEKDVDCTTFNANCVLIPGVIMRQVGNLDPYYIHSMGDFDLGFRITRKGYVIRVFDEYVGICNDNPTEGTWQDTSLKFSERLKKKESFKGLPRKDWFHYLKNNFGIVTAVFRSITPYIKMMLHK